MRLTLINQFYPPDLAPTGHLAASLAEHRARLGDSVTVITSRGGYVPESAAPARGRTAGGPRVIRLWSPGLGKSTHPRRLLDYGSFYAGALVRMALLPRQDVIVSLTTPPFVAWAGALHKCLHPGVRLVLWNMDCYPEVLERSGALDSGSRPSRLMRSLNRRLFRRLDHLVCLDEAMEELLRSQYSSKPGSPPVSVIPNWERAALFPAGLEPPPWPAAADLGLGDRFVVLYLGNAGVGHRFESVLDAAERLRDEPVTFLFVGGGAAWPELEQAKAARNLENLVLHRYVPKQETPSVMGLAGAALITLRDAFAGVISPSKLHANLAMGLPVIYLGPEWTNVDKALRRFDCGVSLRHGEVEALVGFIRRLMGDPDFRSGYRARARGAFEAAYCEEVALPKFDRVFAKLLAAPD